MDVTLSAHISDILFVSWFVYGYVSCPLKRWHVWLPSERSPLLASNSIADKSLSDLVGKDCRFAPLSRRNIDEKFLRI
jgi:hypothetical protein